MRRILALILAVAIVLCAFASCASSKPADTEKKNENKNENVDKKPEENNSDEVEETITTENYTRIGNKITFGTYPQTLVTDKDLENALSAKAGDVPTADDAKAWKSYGYYVSGSVSDYMWYIDVENEGEKYRGVYFDSYRPYSTDITSSPTNTNQRENSYSKNTVYWFKYEPISWSILREDAQNDTALIICDMIIDSQAYQNTYLYDSNTYEYYNVLPEVPEKTFANNYAYSTVRKWLNETFYNTAFSDLQKEIIITTTVDNSASTTSSTENNYVCENTEDKIFLLSYADISNGGYGLNSDNCQKKNTDYAKAQGSCTYLGGSYDGNGWWWLRSPNDYLSYSARVVYSDGKIYRESVEYVNRGIVPVLQIQF